MRFLRRFRWPLIMFLSLAFAPFFLVPFQSPPLHAAPLMQGGALVTHSPAKTIATQQTPSSGSCVFNGLDPFSPVNICDIAGRLAQAFGYSFRQNVQTIATQTETFVESIPAQATYNNPAVKAMWNTTVAAVDVLIGMVILWTGLQYLLHGTSAVEYASLIETIPRLLLTLLVVHFSLTLEQFLIDFTNALCSTVEGSFIPSVLIGSNDNLNLFVGVLSMFRSLLALFLILQAALEIAGIVVAIPLGPLCLLCLFHPDTQRIGRTWISAFSALCLMRFFQVLALVLGEQMLTAGFLNTMPNAEVLNLVLGIGVLGITAMIPDLLRQWILVPISGNGRAVTTAVSTAASYFVSGGGL